MLINLMKSGNVKGTDVIVQKLQAGRLFYRWGVVLGRKLEDILNEERTDMENQPTQTRREDVNFLYQGTVIINFF